MKSGARAFKAMWLVFLLPGTSPAQPRVDCNRNGTPDRQESIENDCDRNGVPDECQLVAVERGLRVAGSYAGPGSMNTLALGDLDGDGDLDAACGSTHTRSISSFLNDGAARFDGPIVMDLDEGPRALRLADLDRDSRLDLVLARSLSVFVLLGDGRGRFTPGETFIEGMGPVDIQVGDFDLDGDVDIVSLNDVPDFQSPGNISFFRNRGDGAFDAPLSFAAAVDPDKLHAADIDGDGDLDLLVANRHGPLVAIRNDTASFSRLWEADVGNRNAAVFADLVGDANLDVFAMNHGLNSLSIHSGGAAGAFARWNTYHGVTHQTTVMEALDMDLDGDLDVVAGSAELNGGVDHGDLQWFRNDALHFTFSRRMAASSFPAQLAAGDLDRDGAPDIALVNTRGFFTVLRNVPGEFGTDCNGNGVPDPCEPGDCNGNSSPDACDIEDGYSGDCDANGIPDECDPDPDCNRNRVPDACDLMMGSSGDCDGNTVPDECEVGGRDCNANRSIDECDIASFRSPDCNRNGIPDECDLVFVFRLEASRMDLENTRPLVRAADLDRDGYQDLLLASSSLRPYFGGEGGSLRAGPEVPLDSPARSLIAADLDEDGTMDAALVLADGVAVIAGDGQGGFRPPSKLLAGDLPRHLAAGDLDLDGDLDLAVANEGSGDISLLLSSGPGAFSDAVSLPVGSGVSGIHAADLDGDGRLDLLTSAASSPGRQQLVLFRGTPDGFRGGAILPLPGIVHALLTGDLDGDGRLDVVVASRRCDGFSCPGLVVLLRNLGGAVLLEMPALISGFESLDLALSDLDGDGDLDLVRLDTALEDKTGHHPGLTVTVLRNDGQGGFRERSHHPAPAEPRSVAVADLGGSGLPDLAVGSIGALWILRNASGPYSRDRDGDGAPDECLDAPFDRGDVNEDGAFDIADPMGVLLHLFAGAGAPGCLHAADMDDSGSMNLTDAVYGLMHLFAGGTEIPEPFGACGFDRTEDALGCASFPPCS